MKEAIGYYQKAMSTLDVEEQKAWYKKVQDLSAYQRWAIGTTGPAPSVTIVSKRLGNFSTDRIKQNY